MFALVSVDDVSAIDGIQIEKADAEKVFAIATLECRITKRRRSGGTTDLFTVDEITDL